MNRIFTIIIAGALLLIGISAITNKKGQNAPPPEPAEITTQDMQDVPDTGIEAPDSSAPAEAVTLTREEQLDKSIREDMGIPEPVKKDTSSTGGRTYSDEEEWAITSQTQNDLSALGSIINK